MFSSLLPHRALRPCLLFIAFVFLFLFLKASYSEAAGSNRTIRVSNREMIKTLPDGTKDTLYLDVVKHMAARDGFNVKFISCSMHECLKMLKMGKIDLLGPMAYSTEREAMFDFSSETVLLDWSVVYSRKGSKIDNVLDLKGKRVASLTGSMLSRKLKVFASSFGVEFEIVPTIKLIGMFKLVQDGQADALVVNRSFGAKNAHRFSNVRKTSMIFSPMDIRYAVAGGRNAELLDGIDKSVSELKADPDSIYYKALNKRYNDYAHPGLRIPQWLKWTGAVGGGLLLFTFFVSLWLKHMVTLRTEELRRNEEAYRNIINTTSEGFWRSDDGNRFVEVNDALQAMLGYSREELLRGSCAKFASFESQSVLQFQRSLRERQIQRRFEACFKRKDGTEFAALINATTIMGPDGKAVSSFGFITDISELKAAEEDLKASLADKEVLLREVHHRVKNNLQIITSMLSLQGRMSPNDELGSLLMETRGRIMSMANVHEHLYRSGDLAHIDVGGYIWTLSEHVFSVYNVRPQETLLDVDVGDLSMGIDMLVPCGLILNELLTNAVKYAMGEHGGTLINVSLKKDGAGYVLKVRDDGPGLPEGYDPRKSESLGGHLIMALVDQMEGQLHWANDGGASLTVSIPVHSIQSGRG